MELNEIYNGMENGPKKIHENFTRLGDAIDGHIVKLLDGPVNATMTNGKSMTRNLKGFSHVIVTAGLGSAANNHHETYFFDKDPDSTSLKFVIQGTNIFDDVTSNGWEMHEADVTIEGTTLKLPRAKGVNNAGTVYNNTNALQVWGVYGIAKP